MFHRVAFLLALHNLSSLLLPLSLPLLKCVTYEKFAYIYSFFLNCFFLTVDSVFIYMCSR